MQMMIRPHDKHNKQGFLIFNYDHLLFMTHQRIDQFLTVESKKI